MRKILISLLSIFFCVTSYAGEVPVPFPAEITGGKGRLEEWVRVNGFANTSSIQQHGYSDKGSIVVLYHSVGSGRPLVDAYVYACSSAICSLAASRMKIAINPSARTPLLSEFSASKKTLLLRTSDGVIALKVTLGN